MASLCWSAAEQTDSIRLCSEVTNCELPQMQAKLEIAQPVAEMPASVADCWRWMSGSFGAFRGKKRGGGLFTGWVVLTAQLGSSVRAPRSTRAPAVAKGAARRARVAIEYFILASFGFKGLWFVCLVLNIKN